MYTNKGFSLNQHLIQVSWLYNCEMQNSLIALNKEQYFVKAKKNNSLYGGIAVIINGYCDKLNFLSHLENE